MLLAEEAMPPFNTSFQKKLPEGEMLPVVGYAFRLASFHFFSEDFISI